MSKRLIIGISGASGAVYGVRALDMLAELGVETHLVLTKAAELTLASEGLPNSTALKSRASYVHKISDVGASIASGSFKTDGMLIAPCSVRTMGEIATGVTSNLLTRAADVQLKERRRVVLMLRETPYHLGHIRTMAAVTEMGGIIFPPVPAFYAQLETLDAVVTQSVGRALDLLGFEVKGIKRWGEDVGPV
ncbi:MAG: UbiX family flavin prenyltransferase [Hyphomonadaceae bacterium]|jgi:4-hydroxy-3-polyprenylbenzoate decarboxylase